MKNPLYHAILAGALLVGTAVPLVSQQTPPYPTTNDLGETNLGGTNLTRRQQWQAFHQQMAAQIQAQDAQLQQLVTQMNNAPENQKADAVAAVVNQLVEDRLTLHQQMQMMHQQMQGTNTNAVPEEGTPPTPPTPP